ncbi:hypothetical protein MNV49_007413 [Pseudohyphozyma bogoriensis]|nr:hypothetical protein MNV49_007413 [Pseudohyphozyma bogoriensis]
MLTLLFGVLLAVVAVIIHSQWPRIVAHFRVAPSVDSTPATPEERPYGVWEPQEFDYPKVSPWREFDVDQTKPIPFRPFRWGPNYPINMGIRSMNWDDWLQLDSDYRKTHVIRSQRTRDQKDLATVTLPGFRPHAFECLVEMASFLAARYPQMYRVERRKYDAEKEETWGDSLVGKEGGAVKLVRNLATNEVFDFDEIERVEGKDWNPMKVAGLLQMDDLAVMVEAADGQYFFQSGSICTAGFWRLQDKIGQPLEEIHSRGAVPKWREKLKFSMERFFQKMKIDKPVERNNYFFQIDDGLAWSQNTNGPEPIWDQTNKEPKPHLLAKSEDASWKAPEPTKDVNNVWFRTERQSLRRMPKTGCILFTIRTYFHRVTEFANEPGVPGRMASAIASWPEDVAKYKGADLYVPILMPYLEELHRKQIEDGVVKQNADGDWEANEDRKYPF